MNIRKRGVIGFILVLFLILSSFSAYGLKTVPIEQELGELTTGKQFQQIFSVQNDGSKPEKVILDFAPYSDYFSKYVSIMPREFIINPGKTQNVQLIVSIPDVWGPETHRLEVIDKNSIDDIFSLSFSLSGTPIQDLRLVDVVVNDVAHGELIPLSLKLKNYGNIIAYAQPQVSIEKDHAQLGIVDYQSTLQILPGDEYELTLTYSDELAEGDYDLRVLFDYNSLYRTNELVRSFSVLGAKSFERNIKAGDSLDVSFIDFGMKGASYSYEVLYDDEIVSNGVDRAYVESILIEDIFEREGIYDLHLSLNPELENKQIVIKVMVAAKSSSFFLYFLIFVIILSVLYFLNIHHMVELLFLKEKIRKERIRIQFMERRLNKLMSKTHALIEGMRAPI